MWGHFGFVERVVIHRRYYVSGWRDTTPIVEKQVEKKKENEMDTGVCIQWFIQVKRDRNHEILTQVHRR